MEKSASKAEVSAQDDKAERSMHAVPQNDVSRSARQRYVVIPTMIGMATYVGSELSYFLHRALISDEGVAYTLKIATFCVAGALLAPYLFERYYPELLFGENTAVSRRQWQIVVFAAFVICLPFAFVSPYRLGDIRLSRDGFGVLSFESLIKAPLFEELLFRGVLVGLSCRTLNSRQTVGINGVLFGLWHLATAIALAGGFTFESMLLVVLSGLFGAALAAVRLRSRSLWLCVILHSLINILMAVTGFPPFPSDTDVS